MPADLTAGNGLDTRRLFFNAPAEIYRNVSYAKSGVVPITMRIMRTRKTVWSGKNIFRQDAKPGSTATDILVVATLGPANRSRVPVDANRSGRVTDNLIGSVIARLRREHWAKVFRVACNSRNRI